MNIRKVHFLSGLIISIFVGLHLFNHFTSIFGVEYHITVMDKLRLVYRNVIVETMLLIAVLIQIVSGIKLFLLTRKQKTKFFPKLQIWSGLYLALFFVIHVGAVLTGRFILNLDTNFYFGVAGLNTFPVNLFFLPYYSLAIMAFFGHIASIHTQKMSQVVFGLTARLQAQLLILLGVAITITIIYGLTNGFTGVEIPEAYNVLIGK